MDRLLAAADQAARGWAKEPRRDAVLDALELMAEDDPRRREVRLRQAVTAQALTHLVQGGRRAPGGPG